MNSYKIVITDSVGKDIYTEERILKENLGSAAIIKKFQVKDAEEIRNEILDCDAIITCYTLIKGNLIADLQKCRIIARYGIGVDNIDLRSASAKSIYVTNVPDYCVDEVSDHTMALILNLIRKIKLLDRVAEHWELSIAKPITRIADLTLGIIGFGKIARLVAKKANAFGFKILAYDKYMVGEEIYRKYDVEKSSFEDLLMNSDVITLHIPFTEETDNLIAMREFDLMKKKPLIINTSRGGIINEDDLYKAIGEGKVYGAGLDVLSYIPPGKDNPLFELDNVIITPHAAFYSEGSIEEMEARASMEVVRALTGKKPENIVNKEAF